MPQQQYIIILNTEIHKREYVSLIILQTHNYSQL